MKKSHLIIVFFCFIFLANNSFGQNLALFNDYLGRVLIFDNGEIKQTEHLAVKSFQVGNNSVAYEDNTGTFKVYNNHYLHTASSFVSEYVVTNNLILFRLNTQLKLFDNGNIKTLGVTVPFWAVGDEIIVWYDDLDKKLNAYFDRKIFELDDALASGVLSDFHVGKNTAVFKDSRNNISIFSSGDIYEVGFSDRIKSIKAGKDIVAFVEEPLNDFQVFYNGDFIEIEPFEPVSYEVADGFVAYVDNSNYLKIFSNYTTTTVSMQQPDFYHAKDNMLIYGVQNYFRVFYNGNEYTLENFIPDNFKMNNDVVVYTDQHGNLKYFQNGKTDIISYEKLNNFELMGNCVRYSFGVRSENIYSNGRTYRND